MKMKRAFILPLLALAGLAPVAPTVQAAPFNPEDLLLAFHATGGTGGTQSYVFNLGSSFAYRDNPNLGFVANIGTDLSMLFGANWFTRTDLYWGIAGAWSSAPSGTLNGDPSRTNYVSRATTAPGASSPWVVPVSALATAANDIKSFQTSFADAGSVPTANSGGRGIIYSDNLPNSWESFNSQPGGPSFTIYTGGIEGSFGTGTQTAQLDLYRILNRTTGANPGGTAGTGSYETTFTIDAAGNIAAVPEPSTVAFLAVAGVGAAAAAWRKRRAKAQLS